MPPAYSAGTVTATFVWLAAGTSTNTVLWGCQAGAYPDLTTLDTAYGDIVYAAADAHSSTANQVQKTAATDAITIAGSPAASTYVMFRVARDSGTDTLAVTASLLAVIITYT
jgi:NADPH-dependent curcumin reductase CurA